MPFDYAKVQERTEEAIAVVDTQAGEIRKGAMILHIESEEDFGRAADFIREAKKLLKGFEEERTALVKPLNDHVKMINEKFKAHTGPLKDGIKIASEKAIEWKTEQDKIAAEIMRKAEEKAEKERKRLEKLAAKQEAAGKAEKAQETLAKADNVAPPTHAVPPPVKVAGTSFAGSWKAEVVDLKAICHGVHLGTIPVNMVKASMPDLNKAARAFQGSMTWPGVRFVKTTSMSSR